MAANDDPFLRQTPFQPGTKLHPPTGIEFLRHNFDDDDVVACFLAVTSPNPFSGSTAISGQSPKPVDKITLDVRKNRGLKRPARIVRARQQDLNKMHGQPFSPHNATGTLFSLTLEGLSYQNELISAEEESRLLEWVKDLPFEPFQFHGYTGKRRIVSYGRQYDFAGRTLKKAPALPAMLSEARDRAATLCGLQPDEFVHALITEYAPGAGIGWHRDKAAFGTVVGLSLGAGCILRFRRKREDKWQRYNQPLNPRSGYALQGPARTMWEHSIAAHERLRYSITFRSLRTS